MFDVDQYISRENYLSGVHLEVSEFLINYGSRSEHKKKSSRVPQTRQPEVIEK